MVIYVDIDETICEHPTSNGARDYSLAKPMKKNIQKINKMFEAGHEIVYWTARGSRTGIDWTDLTSKQLESWGVKFHKLKMGKPSYDLFICDKAINSREFFILEEIE